MDIQLSRFFPILATLPQREIRKIRFFVGVTIAIAIAFIANWPLAFITPVLVAKFLESKKPKLPFKKLLSIFFIVLSAFILSSLFTKLLLPFPIVFMLLMTLLIFWISYWNNSGGNELVITMLLIGFTITPMLTLLHQEVAQIFIFGLLFSCFTSLIIIMIMHELIADHTQDEKLNNTQTEIAPNNKTTRVKLSLLSTLMIMPVMLFFFSFDLSSSVLILVFITMLAQKPDLVAGVKGSKALLIGNTIGGLVAIAMYSILTIAPNFIFLMLLFSLVVIVFSRIIFSEKALAPIYAMAFTTVIILIFGATSGTADADEKFYTRIFQIGCACAYIVVVTIAANPIIKKISQA